MEDAGERRALSPDEEATAQRLYEAGQQRASQRVERVRSLRRPTLTESLEELERTDPAVARAAENYSRTVSRILGCPHRVPCPPGRCSATHDTGSSKADL